MRRWVKALILLPLAMVAVLAVLWPDTRHRVETWLTFRLLHTVPPPLLAGQNGRLFLGNHAGSPPGSLIRGVCDTSPDAVAHAIAWLDPLLAALKATDIPARLLIIPTAPRLYPEDLPQPYACPHPGADALVVRLDDPAVLYPLGLMRAMKPHFDAIPRANFHWAGEAPLRVAEWAAADLGLKRALELGLRNDNRRSDLDGFNRGMGVHSRIREPSLVKAGVVICEGGGRCPASPSPAITTYTRPGPGRILVIADSFGDEIGRDFTEFAGQVWLVRMNVALDLPPGPTAQSALDHFKPNAIVVVYHDAGALALDEPSRLSLGAATAILQAGQP